jgi:hypothetical protein
MYLATTASGHDKDAKKTTFEIVRRFGLKVVIFCGEMTVFPSKFATVDSRVPEPISPSRLKVKRTDRKAEVVDGSVKDAPPVQSCRKIRQP